MVRRARLCGLACGFARLLLDRAWVLALVRGLCGVAWALRLRLPAAEAACGSPEREAGLPV